MSVFFSNINFTIYIKGRRKSGRVNKGEFFIFYTSPFKGWEPMTNKSHKLLLIITLPTDIVLTGYVFKSKRGIGFVLVCFCFHLPPLKNKYKQTKSRNIKGSLNCV